MIIHNLHTAVYQFVTQNFGGVFWRAIFCVIFLTEIALYNKKIT